MNKISRTLVKDSMIIHKWTTLSNFSTISSYGNEISSPLFTIFIYHVYILYFL